MPLIEQPLQSRTLIHIALQYPCAIQIEKAVDKHFAAAVQPALERRGAALTFDEAPMSLEQIHRLDDFAIDRGLLMTQQESMNDGIAQFANAELQRASVAHE